MGLGLDRYRFIPFALLLTLTWGCGQPSGGAGPESDTAKQAALSAQSTDQPADVKTSDVVLAGGCFWCMEAAFEQLRGVHDVVSGYAGGSAETADYRTVSAGLTKHAEAIRVTYDPAQISYDTLLRVFFTAAHDPTQINRQYPDIGRQYRSAIFYKDDQQKQAASAMIDTLNDSGKFDKRIATTLEPLAGFYVAEDYHQDYVRHHPGEPYVVAYSLPKAAKVRKLFLDQVRVDSP